MTHRKVLRSHLEKVRLLKRKHYNILVHTVHKEHRISRRTLFYIKEYGPHSNVPKTILKESIKILLLASIVSSLGGLAMEINKEAFVSLLPLVVLLPAINDMIGDYGTILSSKLCTLLHEGRVVGRWWRNAEVKKLVAQVMVLSFLTTIYATLIALGISTLSGYWGGPSIVYKIFVVSIIDVAVLVALLSLIALIVGVRLYKREEDPNNFLIPITTSIADFGNMAILAVLIAVFF
jgi:cation transporter-like permease